VRSAHRVRYSDSFHAAHNDDRRNVERLEVFPMAGTASTKTTFLSGASPAARPLNGRVETIAALAMIGKTATTVAFASADLAQSLLRMTMSLPL
jgi:hypothetical protein